MIKLSKRISKLFYFDKKNKTLNRSNAFPDVFDFKDKRYVAFRTGFFHFPTISSRIIIFRKENKKRWKKEAEFNIENHDVRNPKLFLYEEKLCLMFAVTPTIFSFGEKSSVYVSCQNSVGKWNEPQKIIMPEPYSPFRIRYINNLPVLSVFKDYINPFEMMEKPKVAFLYPKNIYEWNDYKNLYNLNISGTETDFFEMSDKFYFVSRVDFSSKRRSGSKIICFDKNNKSIRERNTRIKLDAPYLFGYSKRLFLLARKNVFFKGRYNLFPNFIPDQVKNFFNILIYWLTPKSLSLWEIDQVNLTVKHVLNFPVFGDTGYAVALQKSKRNFEIYTYSNEKGKITPWFLGQLRRTQILKFLLSFA